jgi:hypothetical protein
MRPLKEQKSVSRREHPSEQPLGGASPHVLLAFRIHRVSGQLSPFASTYDRPA